MAAACWRAPDLAHPFGSDALGRDVLSRVIFAFRVSLVGRHRLSRPGLHHRRPAGPPGRLLRRLGRQPGDAAARPAAGTAGAAAGHHVHRHHRARGAGGAAGHRAHLPAHRGPRHAWLCARGEGAALRRWCSLARSERVHACCVGTCCPTPWARPSSRERSSSRSPSRSKLPSPSLGLGAQPPTPSLGVMLNEGRDVLTLAPWVTIFAGLAIAITVLAFTLIGDGLRRRLDPRGVAR